MARRKHDTTVKNWSWRFELWPDNADHAKLHDYLDNLAESDIASEWIRRTLYAAMPKMVITEVEGGPSWKKGKSQSED